MAAVLTLNTFAVPAFAAEDYETFEIEAVADGEEGEGVVGAEDDGYVDDEYVEDYDVEDNDADYEDIDVDVAGEGDFEDDGAAFVEEGEELVGEDAPAEEKLSKVVWNYNSETKKYSATFIYDDTDQTEITVVEGAGVEILNVVNASITNDKTYIKNVDDLIKVDGVAVDHGFTIPSWQTRVTATAITPGSNTAKTYEFYLFDALSEKDQKNTTIVSVTESGSKCNEPGTITPYTYVMMPGVTEYTGKNDNEVVGITEGDPKEIASRNHTWKLGQEETVTSEKVGHLDEDWEVFNTKKNSNGSVGLVDPEQGGQYLVKRVDTCTACGETRIVYLDEKGNPYCYPDVEGDYDKYGWQDNGDFKDNDDTVYYKDYIYIPTNYGYQYMGWVKQFKNIRSFTTKDGNPYTVITDDKGIGYNVEGNFDDFYKMFDEGDFIDRTKVTLIDCSKPGYFYEYRNWSTGESSGFDPSTGYEVVTIDKHCTELAQKWTMFAYQEDKNGKVLVDDASLVNLRNKDGKLVDKDTELVYVYSDKDKKKVIGKMYPGEVDVYNTVCTKEVPYTIVTECVCEKHAVKYYFGKDVAPIAGKMLSEEKTKTGFGPHTHTQDVSQYLQVWDKDAKEFKDVNEVFKLENLMAAMKKGYVEREIDNPEVIDEFTMATVDSSYIGYFEFKNADYRCNLSGMATNKLISLANDTSTCDKEGTITIDYLCEVCTKLTDEDNLKVHAHDPEKKFVEKTGTQVIIDEATCEKEGKAEITYHCLICKAKRGETKTIPLAKTPHKWNTVIDFSGKTVIARDNGFDVWNSEHGYNSEHDLLTDMYKHYTRYVANGWDIDNGEFEDADLLAWEWKEEEHKWDYEFPIYANGQVGRTGYAARVDLAQYCTVCKNKNLDYDQEIDELYITSLVEEDKAGNPGTIKLLAVKRNNVGKVKVKKEYEANYYSDWLAFRDRSTYDEVNNFKAVVNNLPATDKIDVDDLPDIIEAESLYKNLTAQEKATVANEKKILDAARAAVDAKIEEAEQKELEELKAKAQKDAERAAAEAKDDPTAEKIAKAEAKISDAKDLDADTTKAEADLKEAKAKKKAAEEAEAKKKAEEEAKKKAEEEAKKAAAQKAADAKASEAKKKAETAKAAPTNANLKAAEEAVKDADLVAKDLSDSGKQMLNEAKSAMSVAKAANASPVITFGSTKVNNKLNKSRTATHYIKLKKGAKLELKAVSSNGEKIEYWSNNKKVAKVSSSGVITAKKTGKGSVTVKCGNTSVRIKIKVVK